MSIRLPLSIRYLLRTNNKNRLTVDYTDLMALFYPLFLCATDFKIRHFSEDD